MKQRIPRKSMKIQTHTPKVYDEQVNLLFPAELCEQASPIANMLGISVKQLFVDWCTTALEELDKEDPEEPVDPSFIQVGAEELNSIVKELNQSAL